MLWDYMINNVTTKAAKFG